MVARMDEVGLTEVHEDPSEDTRRAEEHLEPTTYEYRVRVRSSDPLRQLLAMYAFGFLQRTWVVVAICGVVAVWIICISNLFYGDPFIRVASGVAVVLGAYYLVFVPARAMNRMLKSARGESRKVDWVESSFGTTAFWVKSSRGKRTYAYASYERVFARFGFVFFVATRTQTMEMVPVVLFPKSRVQWMNALLTAMLVSPK
jgi:hypothetical protein